MKKYILIIYLFSISFFTFGQESGGALYVSKQTGEFSTTQGSDSKTTDEYESGSVTVTKNGPIDYTLTPNELSIGPEESKTWTAVIKPVVADAPAPGSSVDASIVGDWDVTYSRPEGTGSGGTVTSTYIANDGPDGEERTHEIVNKTGTETVNYTIYSIKIDISDEVSCENGTAYLTSTPFPPHGTVTWTTPSGEFEGENINYTIPDGVNSFNVSAKLEIEGVTYTATKTIQVGSLTGFDLPVCAKETTTTEALADLTFDNDCAPNVTFSPVNLNKPALATHWTVSASATDGTNTFSDDIVMVNEDKSINVTPLSINFDLASVLEGMLDAVFGSAGPCSKTGSAIPSGSISRGDIKLCCDSEVKDGAKWSGNLNWNWGVSCQFPIFGCPYVASLDAVVSAGVDASIGGSATTTCGEESKKCFEASASGTVGGGLGFTLGAGFISGSLQLVVQGLGVSGSYCFTPAPAQGEVTLNLGEGKVVGTVEAVWGLTSHSVDYQLWAGWTSPPLTF